MARTRTCTAATATPRCAYTRCTGNSFRYSARRSATRRTASSYRALTVARVGLLYASSTGHTRAAAHLVKQCLGEIVSDPMQVSRVSARELVSCARDDGAVILGAPTWATGCSRMRTGTAMDDFLWQVNDTVPPDGLRGLRFAVFGCGDARMFPDNFADALDELYTTLCSVGAEPLGHWRPGDGGEYLCTHSKSFRAAEGHFVGLPLDSVNQSHLTQQRIHRWCQQLCNELGGDPSQVSAPPMELVTPDEALGAQPMYPHTYSPTWCLNGSGVSLFGTQMSGRWYQFGDGDVGAGRWVKFTDRHILMRAGLRGQPECAICYSAVVGVEVRSPGMGGGGGGREVGSTMLLHLDPRRCTGRPCFPHVVLLGLPFEEVPGLVAFLKHMGAVLQ
eukprot:CAMPEP_0177765834 /NCGR_PEP_ID=MMETSP0491_2-20121128/8198_1 /TAXON_ID=63592 /ORGANISM="Tetraselmis chuii, Strain PLY429" /LENGTH=389 /DNA_ID=CAMNT_0019282199 /DNA_START=434 /DNA_END=1603 /DNA_ORIENTATION=-